MSNIRHTILGLVVVWSVVAYRIDACSQNSNRTTCLSLSSYFGTQWATCLTDPYIRLYSCLMTQQLPLATTSVCLNHTRKKTVSKNTCESANHGRWKAVPYACADPENSEGVGGGGPIFFSSSKYFKEDHTDRPREAIEPKRSNCFSSLVCTSISNGTYSNFVFQGVGERVWIHCPPLDTPMLMDQPMR